MLSLADVRAARDRLDDVARWTKLARQGTISEKAGTDVLLKFENEQRTGSFKVRGATNRIRTLGTAERDDGVITASAGNHAQGVALAAQKSDVDAVVVMPEYASISKVRATRGYGAEVVLHGQDYDDAQDHAMSLASESNRTYVHAFDDEAVMAGQGTIGLELLEDRSDVDTVVVPVGGGGLISGVATAVKALDPSIRVVGVQAAGAAALESALEQGPSFELDSVDTIADGIATGQVGEKPLSVIQKHVDDVVTVTDSQIASALILLLEREKTLVEPSGAVPVAAVLESRFDFDDDSTIACVLSGGNIDLNLLSSVIRRGMVDRGRYVKLRTVVKDRPGALNDLLDVIADAGANIYAIEHDRTSRRLSMNATEIELALETRGPEHVEELLHRLREDHEVELMR
ncbi:MAG: threonine ammonia-lyase [Halodesulfurarchaeum sp.]